LNPDAARKRWKSTEMDAMDKADNREDHDKGKLALLSA
jgi:hypothetical protein